MAPDSNLLSGIVGLHLKSPYVIEFALREMVMVQYDGYNRFFEGKDELETPHVLSGILKHNDLTTKTQLGKYARKFITYRIGDPNFFNMSFDAFMRYPRHRCDQLIAIAGEIIKAEKAAAEKAKKDAELKRDKK